MVLRSALEALGWNVPEEVLLLSMLLTNLSYEAKLLLAHLS